MREGLTYGHESPADTLYPLGENIPVIDDVEMDNAWTYDPEAAAALLDEAGWVMNESTGIPHCHKKDSVALTSVLYSRQAGNISRESSDSYEKGIRP